MQGTGTKVKAGLTPLLRRFGLGALIAIIGLVTASRPVGRSWEEDLGLTWLFRLRGPVTAPDEVAIVSIDRESSDRLGLPDNPRKWPRNIHARLLDRLREQGASVVVFDIMFQEPHAGAGDQAFAESIHRAGNVILFELLEKSSLPVTASAPGDAPRISIEQRIPPIPALADGALGLAPFALPRVPIKVGQVWLFKPEAGGAATLPMVALQAHRLETFTQILALARDLDQDTTGRPIRAGDEAGGHGHLGHKVEMLRRRFLKNPMLASQSLRLLDVTARSATPPNRYLSVLIAALSGPDSIYLNFYGPPQTIDTLSYHRVLTGDSQHNPELAGRAVFVGAAARAQPGQQDGFYTPYTQRSGLDISGVEIAATAFANLLDHRPLSPLAPYWEAVLLLLWGLTLGQVLRRFNGGWIPIVASAAAATYLAVAYVAFTWRHLWLPLVTPLLVQLVPATFGAILLRYQDLRQERENIRHAFGMHLPPAVVDRLARGIVDVDSTTEHAFGICLASDAEQYTTLSERLEPAALKDFMNTYYQAIFPPVRRRGGVIADVVGDSMLAIWAAEGDRPQLRMDACDAALDILAAVDDFNGSFPGLRLPTRLGLHCGELVLGHVGAVDHYEYRAVGDIVNTTSRIEGLCKHLGTGLLVSEDVILHLDGLRVRPLGQFLLKGKTRPLRIAEMRPSRARDNDLYEILCKRFSEGLEAYREGKLYDALACFEAIEQELGEDGPTAYYRQLCRWHLSEPSAMEWTGVVRVTEK